MTRTKQTARVPPHLQARHRVHSLVVCQSDEDKEEDKEEDVWLADFPKPMTPDDEEMALANATLVHLPRYSNCCCL